MGNMHAVKHELLGLMMMRSDEIYVNGFCCQSGLHSYIPSGFCGMFSFQKKTITLYLKPSEAFKFL